MVDKSRFKPHVDANGTLFWYDGGDVCYRSYDMIGRVFAGEYVDSMNLTPLDEWTPPFEDGVYLVQATWGKRYIRVFKDGAWMHSPKAESGEIWTPVKRLCDVPEEWV